MLVGGKCLPRISWTCRCRGWILKIAILDHDLTLVNTLTYFFRAYNQARFKYGHPPMSFKSFIRGYAEESLENPPGTDRHEFWLYFSSLFKTFVNEPISPMPGALELVQFLYEGKYRLIVVTGRRVEKSIILNELKNAGLSDYIHDIFTLNGLPLLKPFDKRSVISYLRGFSAGDPCISVGDYSQDIVNSIEAGCKPLGVAPFGKNPDTLYRAGALYVGRDLKEVKDRLEKNLIFSLH